MFREEIRHVIIGENNETKSMYLGRKAARYFEIDFVLVIKEKIKEKKSPKYNSIHTSKVKTCDTIPAEGLSQTKVKFNFS